MITSLSKDNYQKFENFSLYNKEGMILINQNHYLFEDFMQNLYIILYSSHHLLLNFSDRLDPVR